MNEVMQSIANRRSIRKYLDIPVEKEKIFAMLNAARWAPSADNLQPWRFIVLQENKALMGKVAALSVYESWLKTASCFILVYLDTNTITKKLFNCDLKHKQAIGAALQNMMLVGYEMGLGTCWIGEILKREVELNALVEAPHNLELMAMISIGYSDLLNKRSMPRKDIDQLLLKWE